MKTIHPIWHNLYFWQIIPPVPTQCPRFVCSVSTTSFLNSLFLGFLRFLRIPFPVSFLPSYHAFMLHGAFVKALSRFWVFLLFISLSFFFFLASANLPPPHTSCGCSDSTEQYLLCSQLRPLSPILFISRFPKTMIYVYTSIKKPQELLSIAKLWGVWGILGGCMCLPPQMNCL